jgi:hypothetical protein
MDSSNNPKYHRTFMKKKRMASKRYIKRNVNNLVFDVVEECFTMQLFNPELTEKADKIIDQAAEFQDRMLEKINAAKTKADFRPIQEEIEKGAIDFIQQLNGLN